MRETTLGAKDSPSFERALASLNADEALAMCELSRLTYGGVGALFGIIELVREAGIQLVETKSEMVIDSTVTGEAYVFALGLTGRNEREMISQKTKSVLATRKRA